MYVGTTVQINKDFIFLKDILQSTYLFQTLISVDVIQSVEAVVVQNEGCCVQYQLWRGSKTTTKSTLQYCEKLYKMQVHG